MDKIAKILATVATLLFVAWFPVILTPQAEMIMPYLIFTTVFCGVAAIAIEFLQLLWS